MDLKYIYREAKDTILKFYLKPRVLWSILSGINFQQLIDILRHPAFTGILFKKKHDKKETYVNLKV
jgi:hypothetical protein